MPDLTPTEPYRPLIWTDAVLEIRDLLAGWETPIYIVGGAVRDALRGYPIKDLDLTTPTNAIGIARAIANNFPGGALFIMDQERGVARALIETLHGPLKVDVALFRNGEDDLIGDLTDRDFTLNAMVVDLRGDLSKLIDPLGGEADVGGKIIRRCRAGAVTSDPVRALRAIRQSVQLGFRIEPETLAEVRAAAGMLREDVSAERIRDEFFNVLALPRPVAALRVLDVLNLLEDVMGINHYSDPARRETLLAHVEKIGNFVNGLIPARRGGNIATDFGYGLALMQLNPIRAQLEAHVAHVWADDRTHWSLLMLFTLAQDYDDEISDLADRLRLSNAEKKRLHTCAIAQTAVFDLPDTSPLSIHRYWHRLGEAGVDVCLFTLAAHLTEVGPALVQDTWLLLVERVKVLLEAYYLQHKVLVAPPPLLDGNMLMDRLELQPGEVVGWLLDALREAQVVGRVSTPDGAIAHARDLLAGGDFSR